MKRAFVVAAAVALFGGSGIALAGTYPPGTARLSPNAASYAPGAAGSAVGVNLTVSRAYALDFSQSPGVIIARASTNSLGTVTFSFRIPSTARSGGATLLAAPDTGTGRSASAAITIVGALTPSGGITLPKTGSDIETYVGVAVVLLVIGLALLGFAWQWRRRRRVRTTAPAPAEHAHVGVALLLRDAPFASRWSRSASL